MKTFSEFRKFFLFAAFICLFCTLQLNAQNNLYPSTANDRATARTNGMKYELSLTNKQYQPVFDIQLKYALKEDTLRATYKDRDLLLEKVNALHSKQYAELETVLTKEQYKQYITLENKAQEEQAEFIKQHEEMKKKDSK